MTQHVKDNERPASERGWRATLRQPATAQWTVAFVALLAALWAGRTFAVTVVVSVTLAVLLWPVVRRVEGVLHWRALAAMVVVAVAAAGALGLSFVVATQVSTAAQRTPDVLRLAARDVEGLLGGAMFWWLGLPAAWFWAIVMAVLSIIPLLGPPLVWVPAALLLMFEGQWGQAMLLMAWGAVVVGLADNVLYPVAVGRYLHMHTVPLLVALIGGVVVFGAVGFFLGPVVLAVTLAVLQVWQARRAGG